MAASFTVDKRVVVQAETTMDALIEEAALEIDAAAAARLVTMQGIILENPFVAMAVLILPHGQQASCTLNTAEGAWDVQWDEWLGLTSDTPLTADAEGPTVGDLEHALLTICERALGQAS